MIIIIKKNKWTILVIIWMIIIFIFSQMNGEDSTNASKGIIYTIVEKCSIILNLNLNENELTNVTNKLNNPLRKMMHSFEYFVLTLLVINALKEKNIKRNKIYIYAFLISYFYACSDEFHQLFTGRTGQFTDTLIDSTGIFIAILINYLFNKRITNCVK